MSDDIAVPATESGSALPVVVGDSGPPAGIQNSGLPADIRESGLPAGGAPPIFRGVRRALATRGYATLTEFRLASGRRADVLAIDDAGNILIVEVKSGVADFRSDQKWQEYREWCDAFYFAVDDDFPTELIPEECGLMVADAYGAEILREAPVAKLAAARRKTLLLRAAITGAGRLHRIEDPMFTQASPTV